MTDDWFTRIRDFDDRVKRNVVGLRESVDPFADLTDDPAISRMAAALEDDVKRERGPSDSLSRAFLYSTAVAYPFENEPWQRSRYSDGSFPVWYGSMSLETTIYETGYHMARHELGVEGVTEVIVRQRAVYDVRCWALLIDLLAGQERHSALVDPFDYSLTQAIGKRVSHEGHPGLLAPSARDSHGQNVVVFAQHALSDPLLSDYLRYRFDPVTRELDVERAQGEKYLRVSYADTDFG